MAFHDVRFPVSLSFGSVGGPERQTRIVSLASGFEERNTPWAHSRRRYDAGLGLRSLGDMARLIAFFEERRGRLHGFLWKDWADFSTAVPGAGITPADEVLGIGDAATTRFALVKSYGAGATVYRRPIAKPVPGTIVVAVDGSPLREGAGFGVETGRIVFDAPPPVGSRITAGFEFDVPVRFDTDRIAVSAATFQAGQIPEIPVVEIRL